MLSNILTSRSSTKPGPRGGFTRISVGILTLILSLTLVSTIYAPAGFKLSASIDAPQAVQSSKNVRLAGYYENGRPDHVSGYTNHARLRMSQRGFSEKAVENCIMYGPEGTDQGDGTWEVWDDYPIGVVINANGFVVTVY